MEISAAEEVLKNWTARLMAEQELADWFDCNFQVVLTDNTDRSWLIKTKPKVELLEVLYDSQNPQGEFVMLLDSSVLVDLAQQGSNPQLLVANGKIAILGDQVLQAMKLTRLIQGD